jgi:hypothetical protein
MTVFENKVQRRIFEPRREVVTGEWRKLHNKKLRSFYASNITGMMKSEDKMVGT